MKSITLTNHELLQLKLLLRDIQLIQKMNNPFDDEAIEILSFKIIEHLNNNDEPTSSKTEISDEEMIQAAIKYSEIYTLKFIPRSSFIDGAKWYREQLKSNGNGEAK